MLGSGNPPPFVGTKLNLRQVRASQPAKLIQQEAVLWR